MRGRDVVETGPFTVTINPRTDLRFLNYAVPARDAGPTPAEVEALATAMRERDRRPRLEYVESWAPRLEAALREGGFTEEARLDLMTCTAEAVGDPGVPPGVSFEPVGAASPLQLVRELLSTQAAAFPEADPVDDAAVERVAQRARGGFGMLGRLDGAPVAAAQYTTPADGLTELVGIGTLPGFRRRGIAAALTAATARDAFANDVTLAFLTPGDADTARVYARAGFASSSTVLAYAFPG